MFERITNYLSSVPAVTVSCIMVFRVWMRSIVVLLTYCNTLKNHKDGGILAKLDLRLMDSKSSGKRERWKILQEHSRHHKRKGVLRQGHEILSFSSGGNRHRPTTPQHTVSGWDLEAIWARGGCRFYRQSQQIRGRGWMLSGGNEQEKKYGMMVRLVSMMRWTRQWTFLLVGILRWTRTRQMDFL